MTLRCWTLIGQTPVREPSLRRWAKWMDDADLIVGRDVVGTAVVSTVFLGLDYNFLLNLHGGPPMLFQTMVFPEGEPGVRMGRCSTWGEAEEMHALVLKDVRSRVPC